MISVQKQAFENYQEYTLLVLIGSLSSYALILVPLSRLENMPEIGADSSVPLMPYRSS